MCKIYLLNNFNFLTLKKHKNIYIYIYNNYYFLTLKINNFLYFYNNFLNLLILKHLFFSSLNKNIEKLLNKFMFSWTFYFVKKIQFNGKGYKLKKQNNTLIFFFNHSHQIKLLISKNYIKKIQKTTFLTFSKNFLNLNHLIFNILKIRYLSTYTKRGLRLNRQIILKRKGKTN